MAYTIYWAGTHEEQPEYNQLLIDDCHVGCGPVAWTLLFCWADRKAEAGDPYWRARWGLYRRDGGIGGNAMAPIDQDEGVNNVIREIHDQTHTFCFPTTDQGATLPSNMSLASYYLRRRSGTRLDTHWNTFSIPGHRLRRYARDSIRDRGTPAIIGTGFYDHYPLAYGYAWDEVRVRRCFIACWYTTTKARWFYVNKGWGGYGNEWVEASTWFAGEIYP